LQQSARIAVYRQQSAAKWLHRRFQRKYGRKTEFGLGGARTHNQRLRRAIVVIYKILRGRTFKGPIAGLRLLPISAIYGPNASRKSNLVKALRLVQDLVVDGTRPGGNIPVHPFRLDQARIAQPFRFKVEFLAGDKAFAYQFAATSREVVEESLHELRPTADQLVLSRPPAGSEHPYQFGPASGTEADAKER
jgi:hypothetical protein